jgi:hypothetical protein
MLNIQNKTLFGYSEVVAKGLSWLVLPILVGYIEGALYKDIYIYFILISTLSMLISLGVQRLVLLNVSIESIKGNLKISIFLLFLASVILYLNGFYLAIYLFFATLLLHINKYFYTKIRYLGNLKMYVFSRYSYVFSKIFLIVYFLDALSVETYLSIEIVSFFLSVLVSSYRIKFSTVLHCDTSYYDTIQVGLPIFIITIFQIFQLYADKFIVSSIGLPESDVIEYIKIVSIVSGVQFLNTYFSVKYEKYIYQNGIKDTLGHIVYEMGLALIISFSTIYIYLYEYLHFDKASIWVFILLLLSYFVSIPLNLLSYLYTKKRILMDYSRTYIFISIMGAIMYLFVNSLISLALVFFIISTSLFIVLYAKYTIKERL